MSPSSISFEPNPEGIRRVLEQAAQTHHDKLQGIYSRLRVEHAGEPAEDLPDIIRTAWAAEGVTLAEDQVAVWAEGISTDVGLDLTIHVQ
jgi:hypothetical protein